MSSWLGAPTLLGARVCLRPITIDDADDLARAADDPTAFEWTVAPTDVSSAASYIRTALDDPDRLAFAVIDRDTDSVVGTTSYYLIEPQHAAVAIGYTWYSTAVRGTAVNPDAKLLLLSHAFDASDAVRVVWHTDSRNEQSRAAIAKLGATFEGLLRKHRRLPDGSWRTTAQFAMTDDEWPELRAALTDRVARLTA